MQTTASGAPKRILVIEDEVDIRMSLQRLFESEGFLVDVAENGQVALELLAKTKALPNLIILDLMMPVMDGFEFHNVQKNDPRIASVPVMIMTADLQTEEKRKQIGAQAALRKPADVNSILELVEKLLA